MIFNSLTFIFFLVIVCLLYWNLKFNFRIWLIFLSSLCFYGFWKVEFLSVILISTVLDYFIALKLGETPQEEKKRRIRLLLVSLIVNFGLLFYFKYLIFFTDNIFFLAEFIGLEYSKPIINIILPLGISFYTFQTVSYSIDVYRGHTKPIKNFALYGSYVTFFPQLVAGPILRAEEVVSQLKQRAKFKIEFINEGVKRILYGLFLKVVLADNIAPFN